MQIQQNAPAPVYNLLNMKNATYFISQLLEQCCTLEPAEKLSVGMEWLLFRGDELTFALGIVLNYFL